MGREPPCSSPSTRHRHLGVRRCAAARASSSPLPTTSVGPSSSRASTPACCRWASTASRARRRPSFTSALRTVCSLSLLVRRAADLRRVRRAPARADVHDHLHRRAPRRARRAGDAADGGHDLHRPHARRPRRGPAAARARSPSIETAVDARRLVERLLAEMRYSLGSVVDARPRRSPASSTARSSPRSPAPADVMVVATLRPAHRRRGPPGQLCLPFSRAAPLPRRAAAPAPVSDRERATAHPLRRAPASRSFQDVPVDARRPLPADPAGTRRPRRRSPSATWCASAHPRHRPARRHRRRHHLRPRHRRRHGPELAALVVGTPKENHR